MIKPAVILPLSAYDPERLLQPLESVKFHLSKLDHEAPIYFSVPEVANLSLGLLGDNTRPQVLTVTSLADFTHVYVINLGAGFPTGSFTFAPNVRIFFVGDEGAAYPFDRLVTEEDDAALGSHVFNRLGPRNPERHASFFHFPYGYLYRDVAWGPQNAFGHRHDIDLRLIADRPKGEKLVLAYGGSAAWGWGCLPQQMWTAVLEKKLNEKASTAGLNLTFKVANLAGPGHVILHEMITHLLHAGRCKPDAVVTLDGANDLWSGQMCDPFLVNHDIVYQEKQEVWAQILHQSTDRPGVYGGGGAVLQAINPPGPNIRAYVNRVRQFRGMVESTGAGFVWGLQPMLFSKSALHRLERGISAHWTDRDEVIRRAMPGIFDLISREIPKNDRDVMVNFHERFADIGADKFCFWDIVHPAPQGHALIGAWMADAVEARFFSRWSQ